jgi:hypothetical protein
MDSINRNQQEENRADLSGKEAVAKIQELVGKADTWLKGYYWDTKHGTAVAGIKMLIGATIGKTMDDSIEGTLKL